MFSDALDWSFEIALFAAMVFAPVLLLIAVGVNVLNQPQVIQLTVDGLCCEYVATAAEKELAFVEGLESFQPEYQSQTIQIKVRNRDCISPRAVWEAVERADLRLVRLAMNRKTFDEKPVQ